MATESKPTKKCRNCGAICSADKNAADVRAGDATFCFHCKAPFPAAAAAAKASKAKKSAKKSAKK